MIMRDIESSDLAYMDEITDKEALEFLESGVPVIFRSELREYAEMQTPADFAVAKSRKDNKTCSLYEFYIE